MAKKKEVQEVIEKIFDYTLEDIMGERFGSYSKYIIQDRAIPDARDGLKPVQRRILYSMHKEKNTYDRAYRKSAKTVGDVIGNYHPHGDTSIYDAMVRMSQPWKTRNPYIDMHGNNGSIDGDSPAAYRYTEARLSKISNEMVRDIEKDTVEFAPNFDDTTEEPTVLPARFPALLVYGAQGISAGYATNIPPHNLEEIIDATVYRIDNPNCSLDSLMKYVKGPDFPTGGIVEGLSGIEQAYKTGRGRIVIRSRYHFEEEKGKNAIVITEIPFEANKTQMVKKIDDIRIDRKIDGIVEVRDESAADVRIVIDLKKGTNKELVLNYLLKNTDMQISYNFNMVSIVNKRPKLLGLAQALDAFIAHQKEVVTRRTQFDLNHAEARLHIVEGLIKCISILDEVIKVIRASKNKSDAKDNLVKEFAFSERQAEAIVMLQLYRLTNTDVVELQEEMMKLQKIIEGLTSILGDSNVLKNVMKKELRDIKKNYPTPRITDIKEDITEIKIDTTEMIAKEDVIVAITKDGYIKRTSFRSYQASNGDVPTLKENDYIIGQYEMSTLDTLLVFTTSGNYLYIPVHTIFDIKWKDMGKHISNLIALNQDEKVVTAIPIYEFNDNLIVIATKNGMIKRSKVSDFKLTRYSKPASCMKLKDDDLVVDAFLEEKNCIFVTTNSGYGLSFKTSEIPVVGVKASGVKSIKLKNDYVVSVNNFDYQKEEFISVITDKGTGKRIRLNEFPIATRANRGLLLLREVKTNPYLILKSFIVDVKNHLGISTSSEIIEIKATELPIMDRYSTGSQLVKKEIKDAFIVKTLETKMDFKENLESTEEVSSRVSKKEQISLQEIDDRLMTIDDFLD